MPIRYVMKYFHRGLEIKLDGIVLENSELEEAKKLLPIQPIKKPNPEKDETPVMSVDKIAEAFGGKVVS